MLDTLPFHPIPHCPERQWLGPVPVTLRDALGSAGNGKSSLINSMYQTLTGRVDQLCEEGSADSSCTVQYACSPALCQSGALPLLLFDTKGFTDAHDKDTQSLLRKLLKGVEGGGDGRWEHCGVQAGGRKGWAMVL